MKSTTLFFIFLTLSFFCQNAKSQTQLFTNASLNILTANAGVVAQGSILDLSISITNTGSNPILANKIRVQIAIPNSIAAPLPTADQTSLSTNWIVTSNTAVGVITICNSTDIIPGGETRTSIIKVQGNNAGGPLTINAGLAFGTNASCTGFGSLPGDLGGDNTSTTGITVTSGPLPLTLVSFNATLSNCQPSLNWQTESEINTDRFEIERSNASNGGWKVLGTLSAKGTIASTKATYNFSDADLNATSARAFYRLKIIDKDGSHKYSNILPVVVNCKTVQVSVFPNPVQNGKLYVSLTGTEGVTEATLLSISGQVISRNKVTNGTNNLDVSGVPNGTYVLNVKDANGVDKKVKVIIQQ